MYKNIILIPFVAFLLLFLYSCNISKDKKVSYEKINAQLNKKNIETKEKAKNVLETWNKKKTTNSSILKYNIKAPDFIWLENWINSKEIKSISDLKWKVVLIDFWTYSCINCIRVLPYVQDLHEKYSDKWLFVIWIHTPEFSYEKKLDNLKKNVKKHWLTYTVVQDNDYKTWRNFKNRYWPALYLIDKYWNIRYKHFWEWNYDKNEYAVKLLLEEI